jgi:putative tryptophan/tyrosine transport system substrate-binding protein
MKRREFIALLGGAAAWPFGVRAQQQAMPVIGILDSDVANAVTAFRSGLNETGYVEGRDVAIELRSTAHNERLPALAAELVRKHVDVIAAIGGPSAPAAKAATATIPIVFSIGGDPVELGLVSSLNRPGGNITGVTFLSAQLYQKQLGLLREVVPNAAVLGILVNLDNPRGKADVNLVQAAARGLSLETHVVNVGIESDLDAAFANLVQKRVDALIIAGDPFLLRASASIAALATRHAIPAIFGWRVFAQAGGLMAYGASLEDAHRQAGIYVGRILRGARPGDLPVMQPTKFDFVINLKTAKALGLAIPSGLLAIADEVIE